MFDQEISEFGLRLGMNDLRVGPDAVTSLQIEGVGTLMLEFVRKERGEELLVTLARAVGAGETGKYLRLMENINWRRNPGLSFSAAFFRSQLMISARMPLGSLKAVQIENALRMMADELDRL